MFVKILMLVVFFAITICVGIYSHRQAKDVNGFVLGDRSVGPWLTAFAYGTSYFSAVVFIGYAGQFGWKYGLSTTWVGLGNAFIGSLIAWVVLGRRTRIMTQHLDAKTMPDYFGKRYDSKALRITASAIAFVFLIPYTASVYKGLSTLFGMAFSIDYRICVIVMALLTAVYVILGGYMATAINDFIQGIIMLVGIVAVVAAVLKGQGGFLSAIQKLSEVPVDPSSTTEALKNMHGPFVSFFGPDPLNLFGVIILTSLGTWGLPQMVGKFYAIKSEKSVKTGTIVSTAFAVIISGGCYFLGGFGRLFKDSAIYRSDGAIDFDKIVPSMLMDSKLPDILIGIVIVLVLSASMSTLASLVHTSSTTLTLDVLKETCCKKMDEKKTVLTMRILVVFFVVISVVIALNPPTFIAQLMGISWGALAGAFLAPFMYGLFSKKVTKASVWSCFVWGVGITLTVMILPKFGVNLPKFLNAINTGAIAMVGGLIIVPLVSLFTPKMSAERVDQIFACYDEKVIVEKKMYLKEEDENLVEKK